MRNLGRDTNGSGAPATAQAGGVCCGSAKVIGSENKFRVHTVRSGGAARISLWNPTEHRNLMY